MKSFDAFLELSLKMQMNCTFLYKVFNPYFYINPINDSNKMGILVKLSCVISFGWGSTHIHNEDIQNIGQSIKIPTMLKIG